MFRTEEEDRQAYIDAVSALASQPQVNVEEAREEIEETD